MSRIMHLHTQPGIVRILNPSTFERSLCKSLHEEYTALISELVREFDILYMLGYTRIKKTAVIPGD
jgi:hypothetical protein